jgi:hypothetical protein
MAGSGSINNDLHHYSFIPDDEDDTVQADGDDTGDGDPNTQPTSTSAPPPLGGSPTSNTACTNAGGATKRQRMLTSDVWQYLDALSKDVKVSRLGMVLAASSAGMNCPVNRVVVLTICLDM